jgi:hypothetical protein
LTGSQFLKLNMNKKTVILINNKIRLLDQRLSALPDMIQELVNEYNSLLPERKDYVEDLPEQKAVKDYFSEKVIEKTNNFSMISIKYDDKIVLDTNLKI